MVFYSVEAVKTMPERHSNRRQRQAEATRRDILTAARRLFAERGYAATSIADIAAAAETAIQTIYDSVGPKAALVMALNDLIDEEAEVPALARQVAETDDPDALVWIAVRLTRQLNERCADIVGVLMTTAGVEPAVAEALGEGKRRHRAGFRGVAMRLAEFGVLKPEYTPERAGAVLALLTSPESYRMLTREHGWSFDACEAWMVETISTLLLQSTTAGR